MIVPVRVTGVVSVRVAHALMMTRKSRCSISIIAAYSNGPTAVFAHSLR
jgi:hypothetical protein